MGNIDEKALSGLLSRIGNLKSELEAIENEIKALCNPSDSESIAPVPSEPIDISISDIDIAIVPAEETMVVAVAETESSSSEEMEIPAETAPEVIEPAEEPEAEPVAEPVAEPAAEPEPEPVAEPEPEPAVEVPVVEDIPEDIPADMPEAVAEAEAEAAPDDLPFFEAPAPAPEPVRTVKEEKAEKVRKAIVDAMTAETSVMDVMAEKQAWRTDRPGSPVRNVISAISLNDRVLLINVLFKEDPLLFQDTITAFNGMASFEEAVTYVKEHFPEWDLNSEPVYRLMMAARRKLS